MRAADDGERCRAGGCHDMTDQGEGTTTGALQKKFELIALAGAKGTCVLRTHTAQGHAIAASSQKPGRIVEAAGHNPIFIGGVLEAEDVREIRNSSGIRVVKTHREGVAMKGFHDRNITRVLSV